MTQKHFKDLFEEERRRGGEEERSRGVEEERRRGGEEERRRGGEEERWRGGEEERILKALLKTPFGYVTLPMSTIIDHHFKIADFSRKEVKVDSTYLLVINITVHCCVNKSLLQCGKT